MNFKLNKTFYSSIQPNIRCPG